MIHVVSNVVRVEIVWPVVVVVGVTVILLVVPAMPMVSVVLFVVVVKSVLSLVLVGIMPIVSARPTMMAPSMPSVGAEGRVLEVELVEDNTSLW